MRHNTLILFIVAMLPNESQTKLKEKIRQGIREHKKIEALTYETACLILRIFYLFYNSQKGQSFIY